MKVDIYTDGACSGNPGKGGYGIVMRIDSENYQKNFSEGYRLTTNNRMELMAVIVALQKLKSPQNNVEIFTDSKYVADAVNKKWLQNWQQKDFKNVKNSDLWRKFLVESSKHSYIITWVKGHNGHEFNELADKLAVQASKKPELKIDKNFELYQNTI